MEIEAVAAPVSTWIPEDDLLLKNAVEAGASLEALAKGAVQFSRRYTRQELQDRWHSMLYDTDIATQASAGILELEGSASNISSRINGSYMAKESEVNHGKRKAETIRTQYYLMRKRLRTEFFSSADLGFLADTNLHDSCENGVDFHQHASLDNGLQVGNYMLEDCMFQEADFDIVHHPFPQPIPGIDATNGVSNTGDEFHSECPHSLAVEDNHRSRFAVDDCSCIHAYPEDDCSLPVNDSLRNDGTVPFHQSDVHGVSHLMGHENRPGMKDMAYSLPVSCTKHLEDGSEIKTVSPNSDGGVHSRGFSHLLPRMPLWKTMEDMSPPSMPVNVSPVDKTHGRDDLAGLPDNDGTNSPRYDVVHSGPLLTDGGNIDGFANTTMSDADLADLSDSLLYFSHEDGILPRDEDGKDMIDMPSYNNSLLLSSPVDGIISDEPFVQPETVTVSHVNIPMVSRSCTRESEVLTSDAQSVHGDRETIPHSTMDKLFASGSESKTQELSQSNIYCTLNTEDPEIPCNDDIFLLIHPETTYTATTKPVATTVNDPISSANKEKGNRLSVGKKVEERPQSVTPLQIVGPYMPTTGTERSLVGCTIKSEVPSPALPPRHAKKSIGDSSQSKSAQGTSNLAKDGKLDGARAVENGALNKIGKLEQIPLHAEVGAVETTLPELNVKPSSDQEEPDSENDVPYFSDVEAMILEMDLGLHDQDFYFSRRVAKYQHDDAKRRIIKLEQCAQSSMHRTMSYQGALAILYGRHLKHFIRKTEVILGRSTEEVDVDIDLGKEGRANKISRRQAKIKMEQDGSFYLTNLARAPMSVNGKAVVKGQSMDLSSSCLIEVRGMSLAFEINPKLIRQYLDTVKKSEHEAFEWSPAEEEP